MVQWQAEDQRPEAEPLGRLCNGTPGIRSMWSKIPNSIGIVTSPSMPMLPDVDTKRLRLWHLNGQAAGLAQARASKVLTIDPLGPQLLAGEYGSIRKRLELGPTE